MSWVMKAYEQENGTKVSRILTELLKDPVEQKVTNKHLIAEESASIYVDFFDHKMQIIQLIRKGLSYTVFNKIQDILPFSESDWASYLNLSTKTLQRHKDDSTAYLKPIHTEKVIELAEVAHEGEKVFDSTQQFYLWLNTPSFALGNLKPIELLKDSYGKEMVMAELNRIEQGIFS